MQIRRVAYLTVGLIVIAGILLASAQKKRETAPNLPNAREAVSPEQHKAVARRVYDDLFTRGRYDQINEIYASNCIVHFGNRTEGLAQAVEEGKGWRSAAPDLVMTADQITVNGNIVTVNWTARGTHSGRGHGIKPTGRRINVTGTSRFRMENGKIVEAWNSEYRDELFHQIGVSKTMAFIYEKAQDLQSSLYPVFALFSHSSQ